jgi:hypothetical protein
MVLTTERLLSKWRQLRTQAPTELLLVAIEVTSNHLLECASYLSTEFKLDEPVASMHSRRSTHEVAEVEGVLYAMGGNDGSSSLNSVERYDAHSNKWLLVTSMATRRSSVGACVLNCLHLERSLSVVKTIA